MRFRDLGFAAGRFPTGPLNSIADVDGVTVGHSTVSHGSGKLVIGEGPARTGVTVVKPHGGDTWTEPRYAGWSTLNATGEWTGLHFINETGLLYGNIYLTNSHSVGTVRDAVIRTESQARGEQFMTLPVVGETFDGALNDIAGLHVREEHVVAATASASREVTEGSVGGGTGMICHGFKGGIGTASRSVRPAGAGSGDRSYTVGVLVQANHGDREGFLVNGVPVGQIIGDDVIPLPRVPESNSPLQEKNSILIVVATDVPLLPHQCSRVAHRATLGIALNGGAGHTESGDFALAFSTADQPTGSDAEVMSGIRSADNHLLDRLFDAVIECAQEAILNALTAATTVEGRDGVTAHALDHDLLISAITGFYGKLS